jgi:hypothetical protein
MLGLDLAYQHPVHGDLRETAIVNHSVRKIGGSVDLEFWRGAERDREGQNPSDIHCIGSA